MGVVVIIGIASGKGGVGKTAVTVNLALALKQYGVNVLLVDGDMTTGNLSIALGSPYPARSIQECFAKNVPIAKVIFNHPRGVKIISSSLALDSVGEYPLKTILKKELIKRKELVIVDMPATIGKETQYWLNIVDFVFIVVTPVLNSLATGMKLYAVCRLLKKGVSAIIVNKSLNKKNEEKDIANAFQDKPYTYFLPYDKNVIESMTIGKPIMEFAPFSIFSLSMLEFAAYLTKKKFPRINPFLKIIGGYLKYY